MGKTYLIKEFCSYTYKKYQYINFEENPEFISAFDYSLKPDVILKNLSIIIGEKINSDSAIFFDEIQNCEKAITSLKYFCESDTNYRIICAGSLLGVKLKRFESSFPVGKVIIKNMYPMDFEEFLIACNEYDLINLIKENFIHIIPIPESIHKKALSLYHSYLFVEGMPRIVNDFIVNDKNVMNCDRELINSFQTSYLAYMTKHISTPAESLKIIETYNSIPRQLSKENPKFMYKTIRNNANKRDFSSSIDWLLAAGIVYKVNNVSAIRSPLKGFEEENMFKLYLSDTGLLTNLCRLKYSEIISEKKIYIQEV